MKNLCLLLSILLLGLPESGFAFDITFQVNMSYQIQSGNFNPASDVLDVAGDFNNWGVDVTQLNDANSDSIYEVSVTGFSTLQQINFKFRRNSAWDGTEEFPGGGPNREHIVGLTDDTLSYWYNDEFPPTGPPMAAFIAELTDFYSESRTRFVNQSGGLITGVEWHFQGGVPSTSTEWEPVVTYPDSGSFTVQLIVTNGLLYDTATIQDFINVSKRDTKELNWWNDAIFYEVFVRSFYDSDGDGDGDFNGLTQQLDYLNDGDPNTHTDLGVTALWLMPINPSPSYHGYDVTNYKNVNPDYGSLLDFQNFLDAAHSRGMHVIIDMVLNHSSSGHPWFIDSRNNANDKRDFYRWETTHPGYNGPWGQQVWNPDPSGFYYSLFWSGMPDLNYQTQAVVDSIYDVAAFWLDDIGVDGFRLDAVRYIHEDGTNLEDIAATFQFWKDYETHTNQIAPNALNVGEAWTATEGVLPYVEDGGLDFCFEFDLAGGLLWAVSTGNGSMLAEFVEYVYSIYPHLQWGNFLTNHDIDRVYTIFNENEDLNKVAASIYLTLPGVPFIYYGEEIGMTGSGAHENIRRPMQWNDDAKAGFTTGNPWEAVNSNYTMYNVEDELADSTSILHRYRKMVAIRQAKSALRKGRYRYIETNQENLMAFMRIYETDTALVLINTSANTLQNVDINLVGLGINTGLYHWWDMMSSAFVTIDLSAGPTFQIPEMPGYQVMVLSPNQILIDIPVIAGIHENMQTELQIGLFPNPATDKVAVVVKSMKGVAYQLRVFNMYGIEVADFPEVPNNNSLTVPISHLSSGVYFFVFEVDGLIVSRKFVKQ